METAAQSRVECDSNKSIIVFNWTVLRRGPAFIVWPNEQ